MRTRTKFVVAGAVLSAAMLAFAGDAATKVNIKQKCDYNCLQTACTNVGGRFGGSAANGYVCWNDAKGTTVSCYKSTCTGTVPRTVTGVKQTVRGVLKARRALIVR
jgi:hypothetical protein